MVPVGCKAGTTKGRDLPFPLPLRKIYSVEHETLFIRRHI